MRGELNGRDDVSRHSRVHSSRGEIREGFQAMRKNYAFPLASIKRFCRLRPSAGDTAAETTEKMTAKQETKTICISMLSLFAAGSAWIAGEALRRLIFDPMGNDTLAQLACVPIAFSAGVFFVAVAASVVGSK